MAANLSGGAVVPAAPPKPNEPILRWRSRAHSIEEVEGELGRIWAQTNLAVDVNHDGVNDERHVAARTSVMNLVVIARRPEVGERCAAIIQMLTGRHPSRTTIVQPADPDGPSWLDAEVVAHCVMPRADAPETCAETIHLTCGGESGRHLGAVVAPLLIHDLPVTVWWPDEPPFGSPQADGSARHGRPARRRRIDLARHGSGPAQSNGLGGRAIPDRDLRLCAPPAVALAGGDRRDLRHSRFPALPPPPPPIAVTYGVRDEFGAESTNIVKPLYHAAWIASRLGMTVTRPLAAMTGGAAKRAGRPTALANPTAGLGATLHLDRSDVHVVIRPVMSEMPAGTTLRVELLADWRGSELRADVTAEQEAVHVRVWQDGVHALERGFNAPRRTDIDLLAEAIEAGGRDPVAAGTLALAAELAADMTV